MCEHCDPVPHPDPPSFNDDFPPPGLSLNDAPADNDDGATATCDDANWRMLNQTREWTHVDGHPIRLADLSDEALEVLRGHLGEVAPVLHAAASAAEHAATSSAVAWMFHNLNIALISDLTPEVWLGTTPLMRWLNQRVPPPPTAWDTHDLGPRCTNSDDAGEGSR